MDKRANDREEYACGMRPPNARWSGIPADCDLQMRWAGDVIETEDTKIGYARWRQDPRNRNDRLPTKQAIPQHHRSRWKRSRDMRLAHRENPRPIPSEEEWERFAEDTTWGDYKESTSQMVRMGMFRKKVTGGSGRGRRGEGIETLRRFDGRSTRRRIDELAKKIPR